MPQYLTCKACGLKVTEKTGRYYHRACKPIPKYVRYVHVCPGCGRRVTRHRGPGTPEIRTCMACRPSYAGSANPNWRGGVKSVASRLRDSPAMADWRRQVFERDDFTCVLCGVRGGELNADHIWPFAFMPELALTLWNGRTLCKPCHEKTPTYRRGMASSFPVLMPDPRDRAAFFEGRKMVYEALLSGKLKPCGCNGDSPSLGCSIEGLWHT